MMTTTTRKVNAHLNSLGGREVEVEMLGKVGDNDYLFKTISGVICHGIFNPWGGWYVDDLYAIIKKEA